MLYKSGLFEAECVLVRIYCLSGDCYTNWRAYRQILMGALADNIKQRLRVRRDIISTPTRHRIYVNDHRFRLLSIFMRPKLKYIFFFVFEFQFVIRMFHRDYFREFRMQVEYMNIVATSGPAYHINAELFGRHFYYLLWIINLNDSKNP